MSQHQQHRPSGGEDPAEDAIGGQAQQQRRDDELDALLDDIDQVLETNAEEFVRSFVQKGGQ